MAKLNVEEKEIGIVVVNGEDYISLTDMARSQLQEHIIFRWMSLKGTIEYLGEWENLYNPNFNYTEFGIIKNNAGSNNFVLSTKNWIEKTNAIGIIAKTGRYGGTYAHRDIAYLFGMTAKQWRDTNPNLKGNIRDYANINQLICLSNMENINAVFIDEGMNQHERLIKLNQVAIQQIAILQGVKGKKLLQISEDVQ